MEVLCSKEYDKFKTLIGNRPVGKRVEAIAASMRRIGFIKSYHIVVNDRMEITDGQHRFAAAKSVGIPIFYVIDKNLKLEDVQSTGRTSKAWSSNDFIRAHVNSGNENYQRLQTCLADCGLTASTGMYFLSATLSGHCNARNQFDQLTTGELIFDEAAAARFNYLYKCVEEIASFNPLWITWRTAVKTTLQMVLMPAYVHERMLKKLEFQSTRLVRCADEKDYRKLLETIYNYKAQKSQEQIFIKK